MFYQVKRFTFNHGAACAEEGGGGGSTLVRCQLSLKSYWSSDIPVVSTGFLSGVT